MSSIQVDGTAREATRDTTRTEDDMTTTLTTHGGSGSVRVAAEGLTVDALNVRDAVFGDGLLLTRDEEHRWALYSLGSGRVDLLGKFDHAAHALSVLDMLEPVDRRTAR
jgi:hypothetical protein